MATRKTQTITTKMTTVVIPTFKRAGLALQSAKNIRKLHPEIEIIIVDQQNSSFISENDQKKYQIIYLNSDSANTALAKNIGIQHAGGEVVFFFDDDVEITDETIPAQLQAYEDSQIIGTAGRVINDGEHIPAQTDIETGKTNTLATQFSFNFWSTKEQRVDFLYGCNMSFRKSILNKMNGFDEQFAQAFEEIDLAKRAKKFGDIQFVPNALVYHHKAKTGGTREHLDAVTKNYFYYGMYIAKHVSFPLVIISLLLRGKSALFESTVAFQALWNGYISYKFGK